MKATSFYHPANARATTYGGSLSLWLLAAIGWVLGIQFKVDGMPYGADAKKGGAYGDAGTGLRSGIGQGVGLKSVDPHQ